jgi:tetratricopeptide (TPR) repeat protein
MPILSLLSLLLAQAVSEAGPGTTLAQDRLTVCQTEARRDPTSAIVNASTWLREAVEDERSYPHQCLGVAYTSLLRWQAAEDAFMAAHAARPQSDFAGRARLAAMAANSALADGRHEAARKHLELAHGDAAVSGDTVLAGEIAADKARALVGLGLTDEAAKALAQARRDAPQRIESWLLSATLARRQDNLDEAQAHIQTAAALGPQDPAVALEAGVIAALAGRDEAARLSWRSVLELAPDGPEAAAARDYLAQLDEEPSAS